MISNTISVPFKLSLIPFRSLPRKNVTLLLDWVRGFPGSCFYQSPGLIANSEPASDASASTSLAIGLTLRVFSSIYKRKPCWYRNVDDAIGPKVHLPKPKRFSCASILTNPFGNSIRGDPVHIRQFVFTSLPRVPGVSFILVS